MSSAARHGVLAALVAAGVLLAGLARAGGPWKVCGDGRVARWDTSGSIPFRVDSGALGSLSQTDAIAQFQQALGTWNGVGVVTPAGPLVLAVDAANPLPDVDAVGAPDVRPEHYLNFWDADRFPPAIEAVKVIFDADGSIVEDLFGGGSKEDVLGLARLDHLRSPFLGTDLQCGAAIPDGSTLAEASLILNGAVFDGNPPDLANVLELRAVMVHEIGHVLNLGHSAVNHELALDDDQSNDQYVPTMYPLVVRNEEAMATLNPDDTAALVGIYGTPANSLSGVVRFGGMPFQGAQVVARRTDPSLRLQESYSFVSGGLYFPVPGGGPPPPGFLGLYDISGLPPGDYQVCVEQIDTRFNEESGTLVGPTPTPPLLPGPTECWDASEGTDPALDDPDAWDAVTVGGSVTGIDIDLNAAPTSDPTGVEPNDDLATATLVGDGIGATVQVDTTYGLLTFGDTDFYRVEVGGGQRVRVDVDAAELGYPGDLLLRLYDHASDPIEIDGSEVVDDAFDRDTAQVGLDPWVEFVASAPGSLRIGVSCHPDTDLSGCPDATGLPYWLRVEVDPDTDGDGTWDRFDVDPAVPDTDGDGVADAADDCTDSDADGFGDPGFPANTCPTDTCPTVHSPVQDDSDGDGAGDPCDPCPADASDSCVDTGRPKLDFALPGDGQVDVATSSDVLVFMNEPLAASTVDERSVVLELVDTAIPVKVPASVTLTDLTVITLDPVSALLPDRDYRVTVRPPLADAAGNHVVELAIGFDTVGLGGEIDTATIGAGTPGTSDSGSADSTGFSVAMLGDTNGDGFDEYLYGSPDADSPLGPHTGAGKATLVFGGAGSFGGGASASIEFFGGAMDRAAGQAVADAGDLNGDGLADFAIGAPSATGTSHVWVVFGNADWPPTVTQVDLESGELQSCGAIGDELCGASFSVGGAERAGIAISRAEDINDDGIGELLIGAPDADPSGRANAGKAYLIYGSTTMLTGATVDLVNVESGALGGAGVVFYGESPGDLAGSSVSVWPDPDLGTDDLIVGAPLADAVDRDGTVEPDAGYVYAIHPITAANLTEPVTELDWVGRPGHPNEVSGVVFVGNAPGGNVGRSVLGGVDVDGDGVFDLLYAANGTVYVLTGDGPKTLTGISESESSSTISGSVGLRQIGVLGPEDFRVTRFVQTEPPPLRPLVLGGGADVNGDGYDDFAIGDPLADDGAGRVYVVYGRPGGWPDVVPLSDVGVTVPGLLVVPDDQAFEATDALGESVGTGADVNGDGLGDVIVGAPGRSTAWVFSPVAPPVVEGVLATSPTTFSWPPTPRAFGYNFYRGALADLAVQGVATSAMMTLGCSIASTSVVDLATPAAGTGLVYLVTADNRFGEGPIGPAGSGRRIDDQCPVP